MRILLSAYACAPDCGSEPGIGWMWTEILAPRHELHVLTAERASTRLVAMSRPQVHFHFIPNLFAEASCWPLGLGWLHYDLWQRRALRLARRLHNAQAFDLVHHVTYGTWRSPSYLWKLGIPLVLGPLGGGERIPGGFRSLLGFAGRLRERIRDLHQCEACLSLPIRRSIQRAAAVLSANHTTRDFLLRHFRRDSTVLSSIAMPPSASSVSTATDSADRPLQIIWVGLLEPRKALSLALEALARLPEPHRVRFAVIGDGPEDQACRALVHRRGLDGVVTFEGRLPHGQILDRLRDADLFLFPSLRDSAGFAVLEAMASGLPVVCLDGSGPGEITSDDCAIRITPHSPEQTIRDLAGAVERLRQDPALRERMGRASRERVRQQYSLQYKADVIERVYREILAQHTHAGDHDSDTPGPAARNAAIQECR